MELLVLVGVLGGGTYLWTHRRGRTAPEAGWAPTVNVDHAYAQPVRPPSPVRVALALARGEAVGWFATPTFAAAVAFAALIGILPILPGFLDNEIHEMTAIIASFPISVWPTAGLVIAAVHHAATRARRDGSAELLDTMPTDREVRAFGMLGIAASGVAVAIASMIFWIGLWLAVGTPGTANRGAWLEMLTAVVTVAGAGVFGLLVSRVAPWALASIIAVIAVGVVNGRLLGIFDRADRSRWFALWPGFLEFPRRFSTAPLGAHLAWITALTALCAAIVLLSYHATARRAVGVIVVVVAVALSGAWQAQSATAARVDAIVADITNPLARQVCRTEGQIRACAYRPYSEHLDRWIDISKRVIAAAPESAQVGNRGELLMVQQLNSYDYQYLDPDVRSELATRAPAPRVSNALVLTWDVIDQGDMRFAHAMATAQWVVGLPVPTRVGHDPCSAAGRLRGVLALWLAASATPNGRAQLRRASPSSTLYPIDSNETGSFMVPWDPGHSHAVEAVVWTRPDIEAADALLALPQAELRRKLATKWDAFTHPRAPASLLFDLTGISWQPTATAEVKPC